MERFEYPMLFKRAKQGGYGVTCRDLPQLITQGDTLTDSIAASGDAMDEVFAAYMQRNPLMKKRCGGFWTRTTAPSCPVSPKRYMLWGDDG